MGLDALVYCNCVETGRLTKPHPFLDKLFINEEGCPSIPEDPDDANDSTKFLAHLNWILSSPCEHICLRAVHHRLSKLALVRAIRAELSQMPVLFPTILEKVIYSGSHCGDYLTLEDVLRVKTELVPLSQFSAAILRWSRLLRIFRSRWLN